MATKMHRSLGLNKNLLVRGLLALAENQSNELEGLWVKHRILEQIDAIQHLPTQFELPKLGGSWLASVREWIQRKAVNGERVSWGSGDYVHLRNSMSVIEYEALAASIAAATLRDVLSGDLPEATSIAVHNLRKELKA